MVQQNLHIGFDRDDKNNIELPIGTLKRHFAALGSSGSGKTVLVKCVLEECIRAGIPLIIIDIQGDLASLALMGDKSFVERKGVPGKYWDDVKNKAQVSIFTPASTKGIALSMNPLKAPPDNLDQEDLIQAIDSVAVTVASVLKYNVEKGKGLDVKNYLYLLLEAIWDAGESVESFTKLANIIKNDDEYIDSATQSMLEEKVKDELIKNVKALTIGADSLIFNMGMPIDVDRMMTWADPGKVPVNVLYLNTLRDADDRVNFIANTATQIYNWMLKHPSGDVQLVFVLDELAGLVPPIRNPPSKKSIQLLLKQARKYGVSLLLATQNISDVDYKSLGQVSTWALGKLMAKQDIEKVRDIIQSISPSETEKILKVLSKQKAGQFVLLASDVYKEVKMISARWLVTDHKTLDDGKVREIMNSSGIREKFPEAAVKRKGKRSKKEDTKEKHIKSDDETDEAQNDISDAIELEVTEVPEVRNSSAMIDIFEEKPVAFSVEELAEISNEDPKSVAKNMDKMVKAKKLVAEKINGIKTYWSVKHKMDPKSNIVGPLFRFHIEKPRGLAEKIMKGHIPKTLRIRALEDIIDDETEFFYLPFWRIGTKSTIKKGRKVVRDKKFFYVNGLNGSIVVYNRKKKKIILKKSGIDEPKKLVTLENAEHLLETEILDGVKDDDLKPKLNREEAIEQVKKLLGMRVNSAMSPSIIWMPFWGFTMIDKDTNDERKAWIDAVFGSYFTKDPRKNI